MLSIFGKLYGTIADFRNSLYDKAVFKSRALGAKTISVGNITTGGTGKTPLVAYIGETLADRGEKVCILTRGYGRKNPRRRVLVSNYQEILSNVVEAGDEPLELAKRLIGKAIVVADADRVSAGKWAREEFGITAFVLDDGFQHRKVKRDLDIVCVDATNPFGNEKMLPAGRLREPLTNLERADVIIITRTNLVDSSSEIASVIKKYNPKAPIFGTVTHIAEITKLVDFLAGQKTADDDFDRQFVAGAFAFCGIGNPGNFFDQLRSQSFGVAGTRVFSDHHFYSQNDITSIESDAANAGARGLITTQKDAVKLDGLEIAIPCFVAEAEYRLNDEAGFRKLL